MQKTKSTFRKAKANKKSEKTNSFAARAGLRLRPKLACATGVGLGATVSVDLCHQSGLEGATEVDLCTWAMDFRPKIRLPP
jgi:hypothetical protein